MHHFQVENKGGGKGGGTETRLWKSDNFWCFGIETALGKKRKKKGVDYHPGRRRFCGFTALNDFFRQFPLRGKKKGKGGIYSLIGNF